jgi:hypothetical protein
VRLEDVSRAFEAAIRRELGDLLKGGRRFVCQSPGSDLENALENKGFL